MPEQNILPMKIDPKLGVFETFGAGFDVSKDSNSGRKPALGSGQNFAQLNLSGPVRSVEQPYNLEAI